MVQIESTCRLQSKCDLKTEICLGRDRKHCGKGRKCCLPAFSPFPTMFSNGFFFQCHDYCGKDLVYLYNALYFSKMSHKRHGGLVVRAGGHGFNPTLQQTKVFKTGRSGFPLGSQGYGNSTMTGPPVSG